MLKKPLAEKVSEEQKAQSWVVSTESRWRREIDGNFAWSIHAFLKEIVSCKNHSKALKHTWVVSHNASLKAFIVWGDNHRQQNGSFKQSDTKFTNLDYAAAVA
jgi:hypothetical protein